MKGAPVAITLGTILGAGLDGVKVDCMLVGNVLLGLSVLGATEGLQDGTLVDGGPALGSIIDGATLCT